VTNVQVWRSWIASVLDRGWTKVSGIFGQSVQNAASQLIFRTRRSERITDALITLASRSGAHPVQDRRKFVTTFPALNGSAPSS